MSLLRRATPKEHVRILVPGVASLDAVVVRTVQGGCELGIARSANVPVRFLHRRRASIVPAAGTDDRLDGTLLAVPGSGGRVREDVLHFLDSVVPLPRRRQPQRRDFARIDFVRPVTFIPEGFRVGWLNGFTRNLSAGGLLVTGVSALELGDRMRVRFELSEDAEILDLWGRIVRADEDWGLRGVVLEELPEDLREQLARFVHERQRRALAELRARTA